MLSRETGLYVNRLRSEWFTHNEATSARRIGAGYQDHEAALDRATTGESLDALLKPARRALWRREFGVAESLLRKALDLAPGSPEAHAVMGLLHKALGEHHAAYHASKTALRDDPSHGPALCLMRAYCDRFGLDFGNPRINPAAAPQP
jgi:tetratricopeptide (TPR) repeat protein